MEYDLYEVADAGLLDVDDVHDDAAFEHLCHAALDAVAARDGGVFVRELFTGHFWVSTDFQAFLEAPKARP